METIDLGPATDALARIVCGVRDDQLGDRTPCPAYAVADLLDHVGGLALAFQAAATKQRLEGEADPSGDGSRLEDAFRDRITADLARLAEVWRDPAAYDGLTMAGPVELPAEVAVLVALNEVIVHGWDLARATGQPYDPGETLVRACLGFAESFEPPEEAADGGLFGPAVAVADDAPALDRLAGATGRDPAWTP